MFHMSSDSSAFRTEAELESDGWARKGARFEKDDRICVPLYEAKMMHHFDHRYGDYEDKGVDDESTSLPTVPDIRLRDATYTVTPRYWLPESDVAARVKGKWSREWLLVWRDICRSTDERTVISSVIPYAGAGNTLPVFMAVADARHQAALIANLASFALDYVARQKIGGTHLTYLYLRQLPVIAPEVYAEPRSWLPDSVHWIGSRVVELVYTADDILPFGRDTGWECPPFRWEPDRRIAIRCELDATFFHLYGISRDDVDHIMETFHIVRANDQAAYGEYRTKRMILDIYDHMQRAIDTGEPYQTMLDPPPADPSLCHPKKKVGVLAFGSLIHTPGEELKAKTVMKIKTKTPFPVEYGRYSRKRGDAATLVPHPNGAQVNAEILVMADEITVEEAKNMLYRREIGQVGSSRTYTGGTGSNDVIVEVNTENPWVETVLYTNFNTSGKIAQPDATQLADRAVASVAKVKEGEDGITYLERNLSYGIKTPLTPDYEGAILRQTGTTRLQDALAKLRHDGHAREARTNE